MDQKLKNKQNILFCLILLTLVNSISSSSGSDSNEHSLSSSRSSNSKLSSTNLNREDADEVLQKKLFAHYRESYITKDDAKKFRERIHAHQKPYSDRDYDDLIQEMDFKPKKSQKVPDLIQEIDFKPKKSKKVPADIYDKKYFDYLPAEDESDSENEGHEKKSPPKKHSKQHQHNKNSKRRNRRDTIQLDDSELNVGADKNVAKRQTSHGYYYPVPANPWTDTYYQNHRPYVNQHYLPAAPIYIVPQLQPFGEYPSSPPHHNIGHPPVNPPPNSQIVTESPMEFLNRFGENEDDKPIWEMWDINSPNSIQIVNPARPAPTRRPPPSILRTTTQKTLLRRPAPPIIRNPIKSSMPAEEVKPTPSNLNSVQGGSGSSRGPELGPAFQPRPNQLDDDDQQRTGPSRCVWGIVSCCKRGTLTLRYNCFENLGCGGAFWDFNPCSNAILDQALEQTNEYFNN